MARRFGFRLETLLRVRRQREDEQKRVVAQRLRAISGLAHQAARFEQRIADQVDLLRSGLSEASLDVDDLRAQRGWLVHLRRGVLETTAEIAAHRAMLAQERSALAARGTATKVLSRLKEKQQEVFLLEQDRREQIELDEMNNTRSALALLAPGGDEP